MYVDVFVGDVGFLNVECLRLCFLVLEGRC